MRKNTLVSSVLAGAMALQIGCSASITKKDNFPVGTKIYSLPVSYADSTNVPGYADSLSLKEIAGERGIETIIVNKRYSVEKNLSDSLRLKQIFPDGYDTYTIPSDYSSIEKSSVKQKSVQISQKKEKVIKQSAWYNSTLFKYFVAPSLIGTAGYFIINAANKNNNDNNHDNNNHQDDEQVYGGRIDEGSDAGGVRGGRDDGSEAGGNR